MAANLQRNEDDCVHVEVETNRQGCVNNTLVLFATMVCTMAAMACTIIKYSMYIRALFQGKETLFAWIVPSKYQIRK